ncbi:AAA family ATPase [Candidatus Methylomirabilis sp.]|uniref:AAA family ATPase n=1 Tax=Candidatus Methylomirabilis sp. TaxID=2032687 RepID=UPI002A646948|nr:AAA family ATPase [Candidatus Methylomirabilis sp.]
MIKRIEIEGYRLLDSFAAELRPLTVVIGANAVGKSTLLDCLQCIAQCSDLPLNTAIGWHWGMNSLLNAARKDRKLSWRITFSKPKDPFWSRLPLDDSQAFIYEVILQGDVQGQAQAQYEVLRTREPYQGYAEAFKYLEATLFRRQVYSREHRKLMPFDEAMPPSQQVHETGTESKNGSDLGLPPAAQEPALMLSQIRFFNEFPIPSSARVLLANMTFYPGFDVTRFSGLRTKAAEIKPMTMLALNGENLGTVLHEILTRYDYRQAATDIREFLKAAYPAFEEIHCDTTLGAPAQVLVRVREKGMERSMEMWELSDGMLRFLCLASALLNPIPPPFVALDEPESGLHPRLLPVVADMIKTASERTQVLVTTHSPDLLNRFSIDDVAVMSRGEDFKAAWCRPSDRKTLVEMLKDVAGETLGDLHRSGELEAIG